MLQLQAPYQLYGTFTQKKDAPPQRGEGAQGLSGWLTGGQKQSRCLARGHSKSHAYRCLANRWLGIIWKLWQSRELYDETYHLQQIRRHRRR
jgi:hypothetical protein